MGLREQIQAAKSEDDVAFLLKTGETFEYASRKTKNSWKSTAKRRVLQKLNVPQKESVSVVKTSKKSTKNQKSR